MMVKRWLLCGRLNWKIENRTGRATTGMNSDNNTTRKLQVCTATTIQHTDHTCVRQRQHNTQTSSMYGNDNTTYITNLNSNDNTAHMLQVCKTTTTQHTNYKYVQQRQHNT